MTTPEILNSGLQVLRDACYGHGLCAASLSIDDATILSYGPGQGAVLGGLSGPTVEIPEGHVLAVTTEPGA